MSLEKNLAIALEKIRFGKYALYPLIGTLPGAFQEQLAEDTGARKNSFCIAQLATALSVGCLKYFLGDKLDNYSLLHYFGIAVKGYGVASLMISGSRAAIVAATRRPFGIYSFEVPYRLLKKVGSKVMHVLGEVRLKNKT